MRVRLKRQVNFEPVNPSPRDLTELKETMIYGICVNGYDNVANEVLMLPGDALQANWRTLQYSRIRHDQALPDKYFRVNLPDDTFAAVREMWPSGRRPHRIRVRLKGSRPFKVKVRLLEG